MFTGLSKVLGLKIDAEDLKMSDLTDMKQCLYRELCEKTDAQNFE